VVKKSTRSRGFAVEHFDILYQINDIVPNKYSDIDIVEFASGQETSVAPVTIDHEQGDRVQDAYRLAEGSERVLSGVVFEINDDSATFVMRDAIFRQTTCVVDWDIFKDLEFSIGSSVKVRGVFIRRRRRDKIMVNCRPEFEI